MQYRECGECRRDGRRGVGWTDGWKGRVCGGDGFGSQSGEYRESHYVGIDALVKVAGVGSPKVSRFIRGQVGGVRQVARAGLP